MKERLHGAVKFLAHAEDEIPPHSGPARQRRGDAEQIRPVGQLGEREGDLIRRAAEDNAEPLIVTAERILAAVRTETEPAPPT